MFELAPFDVPDGYGEGIVPLADVKAWCGVHETDDEHDGLLEAMRDAAVDMVERYCGVFLAPREGLIWTSEVLPDQLRLPVRPVSAITAFAYLDGDGSEQSIDPVSLRITAGGVIRPVAGVAWPRVGGGIELTFTAGFTDANRPAALVAAVKMFTAHLFANREAVSASGSVGGEIPLGFKRLCRAYRLPVV